MSNDSAKKTDSTLVPRRAVALGGAASLAGIPCSLFIGTEAALAESMRTGRPMLTDANLNAVLTQRAKADGGRALATELQSDLRGFIRRNFALTAMQHRDLDHIPPQTLSRLAAALGSIRQKGGAIMVHFSKNAVRGGSDISVNAGGQSIAWSSQPTQPGPSQAPSQKPAMR